MYIEICIFEAAYRTLFCGCCEVLVIELEGIGRRRRERLRGRRQTHTLHHILQNVGQISYCMQHGIISVPTPVMIEARPRISKTFSDRS